MARSFAALGFLAWSALCQSGGIAAAFIVAQTSAAPLMPWVVEALVAALFAQCLRLPRSWQLLNLLLGPALALSLSFHVPSTLLLIAFVGTLLLYIPTFWTRVPYYPTSNLMYAEVLAQLPRDTAFRFIDLGCGFSGLLRYLAKALPDATFEGVEISPLAYLVSRLKTLRHRNVTIRFRSFWSFRFSDYDVVYAFLAPGPMAALEQKVAKEMRPGSLCLINSFPFPFTRAKSVTEVPDRRETKLYVYRMPLAHAMQQN